MNCLKNFIVNCSWIFLVFPFYAKAQNSTLDSLNKILLKATDTQKVNTLIKIADLYGSQNNYTEQLATYFKALQVSEEIPNKENIFKSQYFIAQFYTGRNNFGPALEYATKAQKIAEELKNNEKLYKIYDLIGGYIYFNQQNYAQSFEYGNKMMKIVVSMNDSVRIRDMQMWLGDVYRLANKPDSSILVYQKALYISQQLKDTEKIASCIHGIGMAYGNMKNYEEEIKYYLQSIKLAENASLSTLGFTGNTAYAYLKLKKYDEALFYAKAALNSSINHGNKFLQPGIYKLLSEIYYDKADYKEAYNNQAHFLALNDSLNSNDTQNKMNEIQSNYKSEKQAKEIDLLLTKAKLEKTIRNALIAGAILFIIIAFLIFNRYRHQKRSKTEIGLKNIELTKTLQELKITQTQLIQSEKMASLGELTAGIAHEIQNPLNFVNNFSEVNAELISELVEEVNKGNRSEAIALANDIKENEAKINHHGKRADAIVKGMLQHSRSSSGTKEPTDINALCDEYLRLSYHGLRAKDKSFNATLKTDFDPSIEKINIIPQDIGRVILNLITNAFYAVNEKKKLQPENYEPAVTVSTKKINNHVEIKVKDNGNGIPQKVLDKVFQPFFTTKPTGQGTGLGLSLSYDIITKGHGGELKVETKDGEFAEFVITL
ncbi:MAG: ATP-binding protein [Ferruginibacter sp.]